MFKFFRKKTEDSNVIDFVKKNDIELAKAYRMHTTRQLNSEAFAYEFVNKLNLDIRSRVSNGNEKYASESMMDRKYEVVSTSKDEVVVKREVSFKKVKVHGLYLEVDRAFEELITIIRNNGRFMITNIVAYN